jgi:hypothetical protein
LEVVPAANGAFPFFNICWLIGVKRLTVDKDQGRAHLSHDAAALAACFAIHVFPFLITKKDWLPKHGFGAKDLTNLVGHSYEKAKGVTKLCRVGYMAKIDKRPGIHPGYFIPNCFFISSV